MKTEQYILESYIKNHTSDALSAIESLQIEEVVVFFETIPLELAALLLSQMDRYRAAQCLEKINPEMTVSIIEKMTVTNSEIILRLVSADLRGILLLQLPEEVSRNLQHILKYPKNTVGAFLNPIAFTLSLELTVEQVLEKIRKEKPHVQSHLFVLDRNQLLMGYIELKELIQASENKPIQSILHPNPPKFSATMNISVIAEDTTWFESFSEIPVVDNKGIFLGIVSNEELKKLTPKTKTFDNHLYQTGAALGELYKIGLVSFLRNASEITVRKNP